MKPAMPRSALSLVTISCLLAPLTFTACRQDEIVVYRVAKTETSAPAPAANTPAGVAPANIGNIANTAVATEPVRWYRKRAVQVGGGVLVLIVGALAWLLNEWSDMKSTVSAERIRVATVSKGHFIRDAAAQGTVIAAVNPTLFATAPGTISYVVRAGVARALQRELASTSEPNIDYRRCSYNERPGSFPFPHLDPSSPNEAPAAIPAGASPCLVVCDHDAYDECWTDLLDPR